MVDQILAFTPFHTCKGNKHCIPHIATQSFLLYLGMPKYSQLSQFYKHLLKNEVRSRKVKFAKFGTLESLIIRYNLWFFKLKSSASVSTSCHAQSTCAKNKNASSRLFWSDRPKKARRAKMGFKPTDHPAPVQIRSCFEVMERQRSVKMVQFCRQ